jgi:hypothetical protein
MKTRGEEDEIKKEEKTISFSNFLLKRHNKKLKNPRRKREKHTKQKKKGKKFNTVLRLLFIRSIPGTK